MIVTNMNDPLHDAAVKDSEEKKKQYDDAMKANKDGLSMIDDLNKEENTGKKIKSAELKKMHLSESAFMDVDVEDEDIDECVDEVDSFVESLNRSKLAYMYPKQISNIIESLFNIPGNKTVFTEGVSAWDRLASMVGGLDINESFDSPIDQELLDLLYEWGSWYDPYDSEVESPEDLISEIHTIDDLNKVYDFISNAKAEGFAEDDVDFMLLTSNILSRIEDILFDADVTNYNVNESLELNEEESFLDSINSKIVDDSDLTEGLKKKIIDESLTTLDVNDLADKILDEYPGKLDIYNVRTNDDKPYATIEFVIENGDWKHDHLAFRFWMDQHAEDLTNCIVKFGGEDVIDDSQDDTYSATHTYYFLPNDADSEMPAEDEEPAEDEPQELEPSDDSLEDIGIEPTDEPVSESLKFNIAKEQLKRYNEGKMPKNWNANRYLENLVRKHHITKQDKAVLKEAFLKK